MKIFSRKEGLEALAVNYIEWERRIEDLSGPRAAAYAEVLAQQEAAMTKKGDPKALQVAKANLEDLDQKILVCKEKLLSIKEQFTSLALADLDQLIIAGPQEAIKLAQERDAAGVQMVEAMARAFFLQKAYFKRDEWLCEIGLRQFPYGVPEYFTERLGRFEDIFQRELARLEESEVGPASFDQRFQEIRNLKGLESNPNFRQNWANKVIFRAIRVARGEEV